jgi:hypothetical protein
MSSIALSSVLGSALLLAGLVQTTPVVQNKTAPAAPNSVTVVGCLRKWEPAVAARGGIANPAKLEYVLADLAPGTTAAPAQPNVLRYLVKAKDSTVDLAPHLNHRVEVTGTITGLAESNPTAPPQPMAPTLTVATVKMISTECLGASRAPLAR